MWYNYLAKSEVLEHIYDDVPELNDAYIHSIDIVSNENRISIMFEMPSLPRKMPTKWEKGNCNTILCQLDFWDIEYCTFQVNRMFGKSDIMIEYEEVLKIKIKGNFNVNFQAQYGMIQKVNAYKKQIDV